MIDKITSVNLNKNTPNRDKNINPTFKGLGEGAVWLVQQCEKYPMVNVSALDLSTAIIPRTIIETKESNGYAGFEAFRRESSGLVVNCLIPSFIVMGVAKLLQRPIMGNFKKSSLVNTWANSDSIDKINKFYSEAKGVDKNEKLYNTFRDLYGNLVGVDGKENKEFAQILEIGKDAEGKLTGKIGNEKIHNAVNKLVELVNADKYSTKAFKEAYRDIVKETHIAENIRFKGDTSFFANNLEAVSEDTVKILRGVVKEGITDSGELAKYFKKAQKLVNWKSVGGLGIIIPLAISMQPINRWITRKVSGKKGAPIYRDFSEQKEHKELSSKEKRALIAQKFISISSMIGVSALSMFMDKPSLKMFQFKGLFPTMDQARIISTATFASRMGASEDRHELRESTVRDIATFSSFYFLGDYVAKGIATLLEKKNQGISLINHLREPKKDANLIEKFWNWAKYTTIKSSDELVTKQSKKMRTYCQIGNILFSLISLGILIPLYTRTTTNKRHAQELAKLQAQNASAPTNSTGGASEKTGETSTDDFLRSTVKDNTAFSAIRNS